MAKTAKEPPHQCHIPRKYSRRGRIIPKFTITLRPAPARKGSFPTPLPTGRQCKKRKRPTARFSKSVSSQDEVKPFSTFTCFSKLPAELRCMVWKFAHPGPRIVELKQQAWYVTGTAKSKKYEHPKSLVSPAAIPTILHVNQESRAEALKWYKLSFWDKLEVAYKMEVITCPKVYFDSSVDTLFLGPDCGLIVYARDFQLSITPEDRALVKKVAVDMKRARLNTLALFPNLESIKIVRRVFNLERNSSQLPANHLLTADVTLSFTEASALLDNWRAHPGFKGRQCSLTFTEYRTVDKDYKTFKTPPQRKFCHKCALKPDYILVD